MHLFAVAASRVRPLASPPDFAAALLAGVRASQRRVTLAALYLGVGAPEQRLVRALRLQCARHPGLRVAVQLDLSRALRASTPPRPPATTPAAPEAAADAVLARVGGSAAAAAAPAAAAAVAGAVAPLAAGPVADFASPAHHLLELFRPFDASDSEDGGGLGGGPGGSLGGDLGGGGGGGGGGAPLSSRVRIGLTQLPQLRAFPVSAVPPRWVESAGVFHAKAFVFDRHTVLLSGANLSEDYFTTRQDRYMLVGGDGGGDGGGVGALADYLHSLVDDLRELPGGHTLRPDGAVAVNAPRRARPAAMAAAPAAPSSLPAPPTAALRHRRPQLSAAPLVAERASAPLNEAFAEGLRRVLDARSFRGPTLDPSAAPEDMCLVAPRLQLGLLGVRHDERATLELLRGLRAWTREECFVATGYFNLTRAYAAALVGPPLLTGADGGSRVRLLTAAPAANGFFGARGISGAVPSAYAELARRFWETCAARGRLAQAGIGGGVSLHEYERKGWTFHAKGLWLVSPPASVAEGRSADGGNGGGGSSAGGGIVSLVGSPNFGRRSTERDLELQFAFATRNAALAARLRREQEALFASAHVAEVRRETWHGDDRRIEGMGWRRGRWIHAFLAVFAALF